MTRMGPNDARHVIWVLGMFFLDLFYFSILLFKYFPGPEMRSQRVLGPLFHLFYYFYFYFNFTGPETRHVSWALVLIIFFSLPRARDILSPFFYIFCHLFNITLHYTGLKAHLKP